MPTGSQLQMFSAKPCGRTMTGCKEKHHLQMMAVFHSAVSHRVLNSPSALLSHTRLHQLLARCTCWIFTENLYSFIGNALKVEHGIADCKHFTALSVDQRIESFRFKQAFLLRNRNPSYSTVRELK